MRKKVKRRECRWALDVSSADDSMATVDIRSFKQRKICEEVWTCLVLLMPTAMQVPGEHATSLERFAAVVAPMGKATVKITSGKGPQCRSRQARRIEPERRLVLGGGQRLRLFSGVRTLLALPRAVQSEVYRRLALPGRCVGENEPAPGTRTGLCEFGLGLAGGTQDGMAMAWQQ